ncbi:hypothetical protein EHS25_005539 [Saitozyma podzolica]|uniref:BZIP domain-containing protein n=1 Tax=Saitozyma podzolica TaxID=1890683 RepID=A0A427XY48_9TREE|nr:hypothetical protein EHS25_005539 [Saitozyma podzolica]
MGYGGHVQMREPPQPYHHHPITSPVDMGGSSLSCNYSTPPTHSYSESPPLPGGYASSPGVRHLVPPSRVTQSILSGITPSTVSNSSSLYSSISKPPAPLLKDMRRSPSANPTESWNAQLASGTTGGLRPKTKTNGRRWGMPQEEYEALNPRDKKQVRNRIGARRFRAKRKEYLSNLENSLRVREEECTALRNQVEAQRDEINDLRKRFGLPSLPPPHTAWGLVLPNSEWYV